LTEPSICTRNWGPDGVDWIVEGKVSNELKSVEKLRAAHKKQGLTYLHLTGMRRGYLLNCGEDLPQQGITRDLCSA
jgi:GxxExxY protein